MFWKTIIAIAATIAIATLTHNTGVAIATVHPRDVHRRRDRGRAHRPAAECVGRGAAREILSRPRAGPEPDRAIPGSRGLSTFAQGISARCARAGLHHQGQYAAVGGRHHLFPGVDPRLASYGSSNYIQAITQLAQTALRSVVGKMELDKTFESRDEINHSVVTVLDEAGRTWGIQGAALRDQEPYAAGSDPAFDAGADHRGAREARRDRDLGRASASRRST